MLEDTNGDGKTDVSQVSHVQSSGGTDSTVTYYNANGGVVSSDSRNVSADGRRSSITRDFNGDGRADTVGYETHALDGNGSFDVAARDARTQVFDGNHVIDENGVDTVTLAVGTSSLIVRKMTTDQISRDYDAMDRIYDVVLDRDVTATERQAYFQYSDVRSVANAIVGGSEFSSKYGTVTDAQFVERAYANALGRGSKVTELNAWLGQLKAGTATRTDLVMSLADGAEHLTVGNTHAFTNNSQGTSGNYTLDHTIDKATAADIIDGIYLVGLGRHAEPGGSTANANSLLSGNETEAQIAYRIITSPEFQNNDGTLTDPQFVSRMYQNGLGRAPMASELSSWTQMLGVGTISRADLLVGIADSPEHFTAIGTGSSSGSAHTASTKSAYARSADPSSSAATSTQAAQPEPLVAAEASPADAEQYASINRLIQSMSLMAGSPVSTWSPEIAGAQNTDQTLLAAAHQ